MALHRQDRPFAGLKETQKALRSEARNRRILVVLFLLWIVGGCTYVTAITVKAKDITKSLVPAGSFFIATGIMAGAIIPRVFPEAKDWATREAEDLEAVKLQLEIDKLKAEVAKHDTEESGE